MMVDETEDSFGSSTCLRVRGFDEKKEYWKRMMRKSVKVKPMVNLGILSLIMVF